MIQEIKKVLDLGLKVESDNYTLNTTLWGDGKTKFEYALHSDTGCEYYYDDGEDQSYVKAIQILLNDLSKAK